MSHVSVVIPVFNSAPLVGAALRSVFAQTYQDFEVIVVDDGSDDVDELTAALAPFQERIQYVRQPNGGPAKARNAGIALASGDLVAFLDADDEWLPQKLERQVEYFRTFPETGLLHTAVVDGVRGSSAVDGPPRHAFCDLYHTGFFINTLTVMMPRRVLEETGGFDERREIHVEDWDLWLRVAADHPIGYIGTPLAYHRRGGLMSTQVDRTYAAQALVMAKNRELCDRACLRRRAAPEQCDRDRRHVLHRDWGHDRLEAGDRQGGRAELRRALGYAPFDSRTLRLYLSTFANDRWRARARRLLRRSTAPGGHANPTVPRRLPRAPVSMVHDTAYRRLRRGAVARIHDIEDAVSRRGDRKHRVLFEAASPMSFTIFRPVYERLKNDPRIDLWFTSCGAVWEPADIFGTHGITENVVSRTTAAWLKVDAYVNADFWDMTWLNWRTRRVHLFHGVAGKYRLDAPVDLAPTIAAFDCLMFVNADRRMRYVEAGLVPHDDARAPIVGYPKVDCLVDGSLDRADIASRLALDASVPTVIYAPTWSPHSSLNTMGVEIVERLAAEGVQVIVKLHDRSYDRRERGAGGIDWARQLSKYDDHPLVRVATDSDGAPYMFVSDAMISDHSSIAFEFMLLDRPIVVVDRPLLIQQAGISPDKVRRLRAASDVVVDPRQAAAAIVASLRRPDGRSLERRHTARDLFYEPGTATDRALAIIYELIGLPAPAAMARGTASERLAATG